MIDTEIAVALIVRRRCPAFAGVIASAKLMTYRMGQLEKKVEKHNTVIERTYKLEEMQAVMQEQTGVANHRIQDLRREELERKLAKLIDVKSLMTLALTAGFIGLTFQSIRQNMSIFYYDCRVLFRNPGRESKKEREERKMSCNVHGNKNANEVHNYSARKRRN